MYSLIDVNVPYLKLEFCWIETTKLTHILTDVVYQLIFRFIPARRVQNKSLTDVQQPKT